MSSVQNTLSGQLQNSKINHNMTTHKDKDIFEIIMLSKTNTKQYLHDNITDTESEIESNKEFDQGGNSHLPVVPYNFEKSSDNYDIDTRSEISSLMSPSNSTNHQIPHIITESNVSVSIVELANHFNDLLSNIHITKNNSSKLWNFSLLGDLSSGDIEMTVNKVNNDTLILSCNANSSKVNSMINELNDRLSKRGWSIVNKEDNLVYQVERL